MRGVKCVVGAAFTQGISYISSNYFQTYIKQKL